VKGLVATLAAVSVALLTPAGGSATDWGTYGFSLDRSGINPVEKTLTPAKVKSLKLRWSAPVGGLIDAQPVAASGVRVGRAHKRTTIVYVGNESGRFEAVNAANGKILWRRKLGAVRTSCADLPSYGITGTPQIDRARHSIFVVSKGKARELDLATGKTRRKVVITSDPKHEHNWSALTLSHGILYVALAGICDNTPYRGRIVATSAKTGRRVASWLVTPASPLLGGGIWSFGGVSADSRGNIFTATGDANGTRPHTGYAEHIVRLNKHLKVRASNYPGLKGRDADFGATPMLYHAAGCPPQLAVGNKFGSFFVYDRRHIGRGPTQRVRLGGSISGEHALLGTAAYWPQRRLLYVSNPKHRGRYLPGIVAFRVTGRCRLSLAWNVRGPTHLTSSPTVANGVLYYGNGPGGHIVALDARTGRHLTKLNVHGAIYNAPSVVDGVVYAGSWHGRLYAFSRP
jgi:outer membrane protein assembly factor BamB